MSLYVNSYSGNFTCINSTSDAGNTSMGSILNSSCERQESCQQTTSACFNSVLHASTGPPASRRDYDTERILMFKFVVWGVLGSLLAVLGFLGNTLSMIVLHRRQMRSSTSYYLLSLAIYDNGILIGMMAYFCLPALADYTTLLADYQAIFAWTIPVGYPLSLAAQMGSIYTCVGVTVERFIAVCRPLHAANTCTKSRTVKAIVIIFLWSVIYNIPRFFHYQVYYDIEFIESKVPLVNNSYLHKNNVSVAFNNSANYLHQTTSNQIMENSFSSQSVQTTELFNPIYPSTTTKAPATARVVSYKPTDFGSDPIFQHLYLIYSQLFFMFLVPFLIILIMNIGLIRAVKGSKSMHQFMCASARKEQNLTVMLIAVVLVFLVCQFPTIIDNILVAVVGEIALKKQFIYMCFWILCTFMVEINAASNFLLYCFFGKKFRMMLLTILGFKRKQHQIAYRSTVCKSRTNGTRSFEMEVSVM